MVSCPINWHNSIKCLELRFGIPVKLEEHSTSPWTGYQMTSGHLRIMWDRYADKYLKGLWIYKRPDIDKSMKWEIIIAVLVIVGLIVILGVIKYSYSVIVEKRR